MRILGGQHTAGEGTTAASAFWRHIRLSLPILGFIALLPLPLPAQQREPAVEVFALAGGYFHGNQSIASEWRPQFGAGIVAPLGRRWATVFDVTTSAIETFWKPDGRPGAGPSDNFTHERRVVLTPSLVRLWRRERFSLYAGGGVGFEHERERTRLRPIVARDENGQPILADEFQDTRFSLTHATLLLRGGTIVSLTGRAVLRVEFSLLPRYVDEKASKGVTVGFGYRF